MGNTKPQATTKPTVAPDEDDDEEYDIEAMEEEIAELKAENDRLKRQVASGDTTDGKPHVPSFIPEGTREELERLGKAINPFNGERLVGNGKTHRVVSQAEYAKTPVKK